MTGNDSRRLDSVITSTASQPSLQSQPVPSAEKLMHIGVLAVALLTLTVSSQITAAAAAAAHCHCNDIAIAASHHNDVPCNVITLQYGTCHRP